MITKGKQSFKGKGKGKGKTTGRSIKSVSKSSKSGLQFPVGRIHRLIKQRATATDRIGGTAAVFSAAAPSMISSVTLAL